MAKIIEKKSRRKKSQIKNWRKKIQKLTEKILFLGDFELILTFQPHHKEVFDECDENKDGRLVREEFKNHVTRVRQRMNVNYKPPEGGNTTPMN